MATREETTSAEALEPDFVNDFAERYIAAWNSRDADRLTALITEDIEWDDPALPETARGRDAVADFARSGWRAFPDLEFEEPEAPYLSSDAPRVIARWRMRGTHLGPIDPPGFAPTGQRIDVEGVDLWEFRDGLICRYRAVYDLNDMARQIGVAPQPGSRMERAGVLMQRLTARLARRR